MPKAVSRARKTKKRPFTPARRRLKPTTVPETVAVGVPRGLIVALMLFGGLGLTTLLLSVLSPSPMAPDVSGRLFVRDATMTLDSAFEGVVPGRWTRIYVHHSNTPGGDASTLADQVPTDRRNGPADHFVIGNGDGMEDGEVQITTRWAQQLPAGAPATGQPIERSWISICLIGDFDRNRLTDAQRQRLGQLLMEIESRLGIGRDRLVMLNVTDSPAGVGARFRE